jgi:ABC-type glutathione transport system ATPase component
MKETFEKLMNLYGIRGKVRDYRQITNGHINKTYYVMIDEKEKEYIFQQVNTYVFKEPVAVMNNIMMINNFIKNNNKKSACKIVDFLVNDEFKNYTVTHEV